MQITDPINNPRLLIEKTRADVLQQLRPGQTLSARVDSPLERGMVQLTIGGKRLPVKTSLQLPVGDQIKLQVIKGSPAPEFQLLRNSPGDTVRSLALKQILPRQLPLQQLLDGLRSLSLGQQSSQPETTTGSAGIQSANSNRLALLIRQLAPLNAGNAALATGSGRDQPAVLERNLQTLVNALPRIDNTTNQPATGVDSSRLAHQISAITNRVLSGNQPLSATAIRQALEHSGLFLEARLAGKGPVTPDLKVQLLNLLMELQPVTTGPSTPISGQSGQAADTGTTLQLLAARLFAELKGTAEGALARIQMHQLASLPQDENNLRQVWQFELPIHHPDGHDNFLLRFEKETSAEDEASLRWSVTLDFDIPPAGPISVRLSLVDGELSSHFTAERAESVERIEHFLPTLNEALVNAGLKVGKLSTRQGTLPSRPDQPEASSPLLDERA